MYSHHYILTSGEGLGFYLALALAQDNRVTVFDDAPIDTRYGLIPEGSEDDLTVNVLKRLDRWVQIERVGLSKRTRGRVPYTADVLVQIGEDIGEDELRAIAEQDCLKYVKVLYTVRADSIQVTVLDGIEDEGGEGREVSLVPDRRAAMLGGAWAANVIHRYVHHLAELPETAEFPLHL
jgi:hypothetical protein